MGDYQEPHSRSKGSAHTTEPYATPLPTHTAPCMGPGCMEPSGAFLVFLPSCPTTTRGHGASAQMSYTTTCSGFCITRRPEAAWTCCKPCAWWGLNHTSWNTPLQSKGRRHRALDMLHPQPEPLLFKWKRTDHLLSHCVTPCEKPKRSAQEHKASLQPWDGHCCLQDSPTQLSQTLQ